MKDLRIGVSAGYGAGMDSAIDQTIDDIVQAEKAGFATAWLPNIFSFDALSMLALAGRETERIELGTAVVPTHSRHPLYMAQQALTTQASCDGRLALGLGPSHQIVIENMLGLSFDKPGLHVREYVTIVKELVDTGKTSFKGKTYQVEGALQVPGAKPFPIFIGGLGPMMRRLAGSLADGTVTWMTGPKTIAEILGPDIRSAADEAGKPAPRICCALPIAITEDPAGAREAASNIFGMYGMLPSYRAMLDHEGAAGPGDVVIAGSEAEVEAALAGLASAGVTDFNAAIMPCGDDPAASTRRTFEFLAGLAAS
jgi:5,10-methylenetetrahydromethanopterin reductase